MHQERVFRINKYAEGWDRTGSGPARPWPRRVPVLVLVPARGAGKARSEPRMRARQ